MPAIKSDSPYGCHNQPRPWPGSPLRMQNGWSLDGRRIMVKVPFRMTPDCMYDRKADDARCQGCKHQRS